jgi:hypothetical protein
MKLRSSPGVQARPRSQFQLAGVGIELVELAVTTPIDGHVHLPAHDESAPFVSKLDFGVVYHRQTEQLGGLDEGPQVLHVERHPPGEIGNVTSPTMRGEDLEEAGYPPDRGRRQWRLVRRGLGRRNFAFGLRCRLTFNRLAE